MQICAQGVATFPILTSLECRNKTIKRHIVRLQTHARKFKLHNFLELIQTFRLSKSYLYDVQTYGRIVFKSDIKIFYVYIDMWHTLKVYLTSQNIVLVFVYLYIWQVPSGTPGCGYKLNICTIGTSPMSTSQNFKELLFHRIYSFTFMSPGHAESALLIPF